MSTSDDLADRDPVFDQVLRSTSWVGDGRRAGIDAQVVVDRGDDFLHVNRAIECVLAESVGRSDGLTCSHAASGQQAATDSRPVIASGVRIDSRSTTEFAPHGDGCVVQHASVVEILNQRGDALIELAAMIADQVKVFPVAVPATVRHRHGSDACFDQTTSHQHVLIHGRSTVVLILVGLPVAVPGDKGRVFFADVQRVEQLVGSQHSEGRLIERPFP